MAKLIVVCGATGGLGGAVARRMLSEGWRVRGITRNKDSAGAKTLIEAGAELAFANYDDVASLEAAFEGANAIFGVTNFWEYLLDLGAMAAAKKETQQLVNIATAANNISSLEHLILHTLPSGEKLGGKENYVPHMDVSVFVVETRIRHVLIQLLRAKTKPPTTSKRSSQTSRKRPPFYGSDSSQATSGRTP
jgi:NAD(P)-dependent dehydrogenase (short-subunit alcohol dehydrogenase family)